MTRKTRCGTKKWFMHNIFIIVIIIFSVTWQFNGQYTTRVSNAKCAVLISGCVANFIIALCRFVCRFCNISWETFDIFVKTRQILIGNEIFFQYTGWDKRYDHRLYRAARTLIIYAGRRVLYSARVCNWKWCESIDRPHIMPHPSSKWDRMAF